MKILKKSEKQFRQLISESTNERYSKSSVISEDLDSKQLFLSLEIIQPKTRSSGAHYHKETEEIIFVLKGEVKAFEGDQETLLIEGDSVIFNADSGQKHYLKNESENEAQVLVFRRLTKNSDVVI